MRRLTAKVDSVKTAKLTRLMSSIQKAIVRPRETGLEPPLCETITAVAFEASSGSIVSGSFSFFCVLEVELVSKENEGKNERVV